MRSQTVKRLSCFCYDVLLLIGMMAPGYLAVCLVSYMLDSVSVSDALIIGFAINAVNIACLFCVDKFIK